MISKMQKWVAISTIGGITIVATVASPAAGYIGVGILIGGIVMIPAE